MFVCKNIIQPVQAENLFVILAYAMICKHIILFMDLIQQFHPVLMPPPTWICLEVRSLVPLNT